MGQHLFHIAAELGHFEISHLKTENIHLATLDGHFDICSFDKNP